jgi:dipeptidyl aminopeptidase/acylaminoacyl peptidase
MTARASVAHVATPSYRRAVVVAAAIVAAASPGPAGAQPRVTPADYERARGLQQRYQGLVVDAPDAPVWIDSSGSRFWYRKSVRGGYEFVLVDPSVPAKRPAFDHERLATGLGAAARRSYAAGTLPLEQIGFADGGRAVTFLADSVRWTCTLADYRCERGAEPARGGAAGRAGGGAAADAAGRPSPDGRLVAFVRNYNVFVRPAGSAAAGDPVALSSDGTEGNAYSVQSIAWSPDAKRLAAYRVRPGYRRMVTYVESSPADQVQPRTFQRVYAKPGDVLDLQQPVLFDVAARRAVHVDPSLFPNPYSLSRLEWRRDGRALTFEYNERGHQRYRVIEVDGATGRARAVVAESAATFIDYRRASGSLTDGGRTFRHDVADGREVVWLSERDGWAHLYLYDGTTGQVKNQITKGPWVVRAVQRVDEAARQIWFSAGGMDARQDPYFAHHYRVNFDGTGLTALTSADANHTVTFSPDGRFYVDTWSRVDLAPVSQLRRASDGAVLLDLERADASALAAAGWRAPESFVAKARDGTTDIYGVIVRPTNFDPARKYPVIESIYAGPHGSFVPKSFAPYLGMQALAELGFVVVQIDGMGTANRSRAFHDVAWKNLKDAGFPDRIRWHRAVAAKYPWYDTTRVGIYGGSAGGQNAMGALLFHPEFYHAAVAFAGCHDNRMDKIWWNEQWMGELGPHYAASSNVDNAHRLRGRLLLVVGELDTNVDPSSTLQVANALIKANKTFDLLVMPGEEHGAGRRGESAPYGDRKLWDFFVHALHGTEAPQWNAVSPGAAPTRVGAAPGLLDAGPSWAAIGAAWERGALDPAAQP